MQEAASFLRQVPRPLLTGVALAVHDRIGNESRVLRMTLALRQPVWVVLDVQAQLASLQLFVEVFLHRAGENHLHSSNLRIDPDNGLIRQQRRELLGSWVPAGYLSQDRFR